MGQARPCAVLAEGGAASASVPQTGHWQLLHVSIYSLIKFTIWRQEPRQDPDSRGPVMKKLTLSVFCFFVLSLVQCSAQDITQRIQAMKSAYSASGSIVTLDGRSIVIEPKMPSPVCGLAQMKDGKIAWTFYTVPLASVTVPLASVTVDPAFVEDTSVGGSGSGHAYLQARRCGRHHHGDDRGATGNAFSFADLRSRQVRATGTRSARKLGVWPGARRYGRFWLDVSGCSVGTHLRDRA